MKNLVPGALDLFEESVALLRQADAATLLCYYTGSLPFVLLFLYFWSDMSSSGLAAAHLPELSLGVALLYLWMKSWQSVFAYRLRILLTGGQPGAMDWRRCRRMIVIQAITQTTSLFIMPVAFVILIPFGWTYAFYKNIISIGDGQEPSVRKVLKQSWKMAGLWPAQNHKILCLSPLLALVVLLNSAILLLFLPEILHMLLGIETIFRMSGFHILNTTFLAVASGMTYLFLNPLMLAVYVLRCFHGESKQTGADLKIELLRVAYE